MTMELNKFLFLDIDGVFNYKDWWNTPSHNKILFSKGELESHFDPECIKNFNKIIESIPDIKVVLSTSWKDCTKETLKPYGDYKDGIYTLMRKVGIKIKGNLKIGLGRRDEAIVEFLDNYTDPYIISILDDDDWYSDSIYSEELLPRFVKTDYFGSGLSDEDSEKVIKMLDIKW